MDERVGAGMNQLKGYLYGENHTFFYISTFNRNSRPNFPTYCPVEIELEIKSNETYRKNLQKDYFPDYNREFCEYSKVTVHTPYDEYMNATFKTDVEANDCYQQLCEWCENEDWEKFDFELRTDRWIKIRG